MRPRTSTGDVPATEPEPSRPQPPPSRQGKKSVSIYVDPDYHKRLKVLALDRETSLQALGKEAFDLLFAHYEQEG